MENFADILTLLLKPLGVHTVQNEPAQGEEASGEEMVLRALS